MRHALTHTLTPFLILCGYIVTSHIQAQSPAPAHNKLGSEVEHVSFSTEDGGLIYADLYGNSDRGLVLAHGGRFTKESWQPQAQYLVKTGFRVLAFDFRGFGKSHGTGDSDMLTAPMQLDVLAAVRYLRHGGAKTVAVMESWEAVSVVAQQRMHRLRPDRVKLIS
jgi:dipeptidyl aminopeptidase/acylaminoacyl peptidase